MENLTRELILYRPDEGALISRMAALPGISPEADMRQAYMECVGELIRLCESHGFEGNLWHVLITYHIAYHENAFSRACEIRGHVEGGVNAPALLDCETLMRLFTLDFSDVEQITNVHLYEVIRDYHCVQGDKRLFSRRIRDRICLLAKRLGEAGDAAAFKALVEEFYQEFGVGKFGLHKAFRVRHLEREQAFSAAGDETGNTDDVLIYPITNIAHVNLDDLVGYEEAKKKLIDNTEAFVAGRKANNCLLFGDAGTGKSSSIKAILNQYYDRGLRIIELYKHQFRDLNSIIGQIKNRNYRFIIYMDDLSFEEFETDYKYLKAVIEGGLEKKPDNILIYATSNRRHLIRENYADKFAGPEEIRQDMHTSDTVQEKLSLVYRFGVTIYFGAPNKKEFQRIVRTLADRAGVEMEDEKLFLLAGKWELNHGGFSGRTAQQFIDYLQGFETLDSVG